MEKIGLLNNLTASLEVSWEAYELLQTTEEHKIYTNGLEDILRVLKESGKSNSIPTILQAEEILLHNEISRYANSFEERSSIDTAKLQIKEARTSYEVVINSQSYQVAVKTYPTKKMEAGLPLDSFRDFLKSHQARLNNRLKGQLSVPEKNILRQRKENLRVAKELYMKLQRKALGLPTQSKEQGLAH